MTKKAAANEQIWTPSNMISMFRLLLAIPMVLLLQNAYANTIYIFALAMVAYASDLLDGYVARHTGGESQFGRIIDPLADKVVIMAMMIMMAIGHLIPLWFVAIVIGRDVVIFGAGMYLKSRTGILVQSNMLGKATVVSIGLILLAALFESMSRGPVLQLMMLLSLGLITASLYVYGQRFFLLMKQARR